MRIARKLMLLALAAIAAMAFAASAASAQSVEVVQESNNAHCSAVPNSTTGGCAIRFSGEVALVGHVFGIEATASDCLIILIGRIDEDGEGYIYAVIIIGSASHNCPRTACGLPWRFHLRELGGSQERGRTEFCLDPDNPANPDSDDNRCFTEIPMADAGDHAYRMTFNDLGGVNHQGADCEFTSGTANFTVDAQTPAIEVIHTP
jgi:hypothetical protein